MPSGQQFQHFQLPMSDSDLEHFRPNVDYYRLFLQKRAEWKVLEAMSMAPPSVFPRPAAQLEPPISSPVPNFDISAPTPLVPSISHLGDLLYLGSQMDYTNQGTSEKPVEDAVLFEDPDSLYSTAGSDGGQPESHSPMNSSVTSHCPSPHQQSRHNNDNPQQQQQQKQSHRQHQCPYEGCAKVFGTVGTLKVHVATHTKERKFKCTLCPATYTTNNRLTVHMRGHTGEKPYHCSFPGCKYRAKQKCSLKVHGLTHMSAQERLVVEELNRRTIPCNECGKLYKTIESLDQHSWRDHGRAPGGI